MESYHCVAVHLNPLSSLILFPLVGFPFLKTERQQEENVIEEEGGGVSISYKTENLRNIQGRKRKQWGDAAGKKSYIMQSACIRRKRRAKDRCREGWRS